MNRSFLRSLCMIPRALGCFTPSLQEASIHLVREERRAQTWRTHSTITTQAPSPEMAGDGWFDRPPREGAPSHTGPASARLIFPPLILKAAQKFHRHRVSYQKMAFRVGICPAFRWKGGRKTPPTLLPLLKDTNRHAARRPLSPVFSTPS